LTLPLRPKRGGFLRPFGCGLFIRDFLLGRGPHGSAKIDPEVGAPQADICYFYKNALRQATALDRSTKLEEKRARRQNRRIDPDNIEKLTASYLARLPYKGFACRAHSFNTYFSTIQKLRWVEFTGKETPSSFQDHYLLAQPRKYFRITPEGREASDDEWSNPHPGSLWPPANEIARQYVRSMR
jgi:hypothetical protein